MSDISWYNNTRNHIIFIALYQRSGKNTELINFQRNCQKLAARRGQKQGYAGMNIMFPNKTGLGKWRIHTQHIPPGLSGYPLI